MAKKVLLAEDDLQLVRLYQVVFQDSGIDLVSALDGEEAVAKAREVKPDLILLDLVMPKKDGFTTLVELKADPELKTIPVFCLTVLHQQTDVDKCIQIGAEKFLIKTDVSPHDLVSLVVSRVKSG